MNIINRSYYSRAALIFLRSRYVRLLFEGGYYWMCGYYSNKYGNRTLISNTGTLNVHHYYHYTNLTFVRV